MMDGEARSSLRIASELNWGPVRVARATMLLVARGLVAATEDGAYAITRDGIDLVVTDGDIPNAFEGRTLDYPDVRAARAGTLQQRAWRAMRLLRRFTAGDLAQYALRKENSGGIQSVQRYNRRLVAAGYVVELPKRVRREGQPPPGYRQYALVRDTGEVAPLAKADGTVRDRNAQDASA